MFRVVINSHGIIGEFTAIQKTPFHPTQINISLTPIDDLEARLRYAKVVSYKIHEVPPEPAKTIRDIIDPCLTTKKLYNPLNINEKNTPPAGKLRYYIDIIHFNKLVIV